MLSGVILAGCMWPTGQGGGGLDLWNDWPLLLLEAAVVAFAFVVNHPWLALAAVALASVLGGALGLALVRRLRPELELRREGGRVRARWGGLLRSEVAADDGALRLRPGWRPRTIDADAIGSLESVRSRRGALQVEAVLRDGRRVRCGRPLRREASAQQLLAALRQALRLG